MAYGDTKEKRRGIAKEPIIMNAVVERLKDMGYKIIEVRKASLNEDCKKHIDYFLKMVSPDGREISFSMDVKDGFTYTPINAIGENLIRTAKCDYLLYNFPDNTLPDVYAKNYYFIKFSKFKELYLKHNPRLSDSLRNNSKWFSVSTFLEKHKLEFSNDDIIKIQK